MRDRNKYHKEYYQDNIEALREKNKVWMRKYRKSKRYMEEVKPRRTYKKAFKIEAGHTYKEYLRRKGIVLKRVNLM